MKSRLWPYLLLFLFGCFLPTDLPRDYFFGEDTAVCLGAQPVSFTTDLVFQVDLVILSGTSRDYSLEYLEVKDISFKGPGQYVVESIFTVSYPARLPGSVAVLVDQHKSYAFSDSSNFRSKQINQFIHELTTANPFKLGGFTEAGLLSDTPIEYATPQFTSDAYSVMPFLFGLAKRTGGASVLYDAAQSVMGGFTAAGNRNLLMLVQGHDSLSMATANSVITSATAQSVAIDIIHFGTIAEAQAIVPISLATGGMFVYSATDMNMVTAFNHMNRLYESDRSAYRVTVRFTPPSPLAPGQDTRHEMIIHDSADDETYNAIALSIRVP